MPTIEHQASTWVTRQAARTNTDAEHAALHAWLHADRRHHGAYARAMAIHNAIGLGTAARPGLTDAADQTPAAMALAAPLFKTLTAPTPAAPAANEPAQPLQRPRRAWLRWGALAAGAAGLALLGGSIIIKTRTGLDFKKHYASVRVGATRHSLNREWKPEGNLILANKYLGGRLDLILDA